MDSPVSAFQMYNKNKKTSVSPKSQKQSKKKDRFKIELNKINKNKNKPTSLNLVEFSVQKKKKKRAKKLKQSICVQSPISSVTHQNGNNKFTSLNHETDHLNRCSDLYEIIPRDKSNEDIGSNISDDSVKSFDFTPVLTDSAEEGLKALEWLIAPYDANDFLNNIWEKNPLHIVRNKPTYYKDIISTPIIDNMIRTENIMFTKNIDITSYAKGQRETHNPVGRAHPHTVWDYYLNGCSIRLLNPQTYIPHLQLLNATLQEFFNSFVGANAYLTPPDSQGFAPHYDDIEAVIMQIEGKKHWRVYRPRSEDELLPRTSSINFSQEEIGTPILEVTLEAGDMLYFPRGYIHQGVTIDGEHSLHVTVSFYQKHCWADLLEKLVPAALSEAIAQNVELRKGLPFDIYDNFDLVNSDVNTPRKSEIVNLVKSFIDKIKDNMQIDHAVDEMAKRFQHTALPPILTDAERAVTVYGDSDVMVDNGVVTRRVEIELDTRVRLLRKNILRMISEEGGIRVYFYTENSLEYEGQEPQFLEIDEKFAPVVETLIVTYPEYVSVDSFDLDDDSDKIQIANDLWENGLIMTEYPMDNIED